MAILTRIQFYVFKKNYHSSNIIIDQFSPCYLLFKLFSVHIVNEAQGQSRTLYLLWKQLCNLYLVNSLGLSGLDQVFRRNWKKFTEVSTA